MDKHYRHLDFQMVQVALSIPTAWDLGPWQI